MTSGTALLLKNKQSVFQAKISSAAWKKFLPEFVLTGVVGIAIFGGMSADSAHWLKIWEHSWKVVTVFWGSMAICLPSLYVFSAVRGSKVSLAELVYFTLAGLATIGLVLVSIAPITGFFAWTSNTQENMGLINFITGGLALLFGLYFLGRGYAFIHDQRKTAQPDSQSGLDFLVLWFFLLLAVMIQMINTLKIS